MEAGRQLDALIARSVFKKPQVRLNNFDVMIDGYGIEIPYYSTNIADAWLVVDKLKEIGFGVTINEVCKRSSFYKYNDNILGYWHCNFTVSDKDDDDKLLKTNSEIAETAPLAICLAALKAVE